MTPLHDAAQRVDLYGPIHKALRLAMSDTLARLGRTDVDDGTDLQAALAATDELLLLLRSHLLHENEQLHPALEARRPGAAARAAAEHEEHRQSLEALADDVAALRSASPAHRTRVLRRLYRHLALFIADNLVHMNLEETVLNQALWASHSDAELHALHRRIQATVSPDEMRVTLRWLAATATPGELAAVLAELRAQAPAGAFVEALAVVRDALAPHRLARVQSALAA